MGAWGPGIFSDDLACDVRDGYRELIEDGIDDVEAQRRILETYVGTIESDTSAVIWIALAVTQSKNGRLDETVRAHALAAIDNGDDLELWKDSGLRAKRIAALERAREQLTGPQPQRKKVRPPKRYPTTLLPGDVLSYRSGEDWVLLRVLRIETNRDSIMPVLSALNFQGRVVPPLDQIEQIPDRRELQRRLSNPLPPWYSTRFNVLNRKKGYLEAGFEVVGRIPSRSGDESQPAASYTNWRGLAETLDGYLSRGP